MLSINPMQFRQISVMLSDRYFHTKGLWVYGTTCEPSFTESLPGNISEKVLDEAFEIVPKNKSNIDKTDFKNTEEALVRLRIKRLMVNSRVNTLLAAEPENKADKFKIIQADESTGHISLTADGCYMHRNGGLMYGTFDYPVISLFLDGTTPLIAQFFIGSNAIENNAGKYIAKTVNEMQKLCGANSDKSFAFIQAHAQNGIPVQYTKEKSPYIKNNMFLAGKYAADLLLDIGLSKSHIEVSPIDTCTNPDYYSESCKNKKSTIGKNAVVISLADW